MTKQQADLWLDGMRKDIKETSNSMLKATKKGIWAFQLVETLMKDNIKLEDRINKLENASS